MVLYLVRHGIATPRGEQGLLPDGDRDLTPEGVKKTRRLARALHALGVELSEIWTSPLTRAARTARLLAESYDLASRVRTLDCLSPGGAFDELVDALREVGRGAGIAAVGHEPFLGEFTSYLLTGTQAASIAYKKGGVAALELTEFVAPVRARLLWLLTPRIVGQIG
ncbi:MAG: phosphohistidine phosphatase SixA [Phycisphaerae bacterium]